MKIKLYQVDAFAEGLFTGNPAAVCPLETFLPEDVMQLIASENNLSETVFFTPSSNGYHIRWFTPENEVKLCGHATLAASYVIFNYLDPLCDKIVFDSKSGPLYVEKLTDGYIQLDFPAIAAVKIPPIAKLNDALGIEPVAFYRTHQDYLIELESRTHVLAVKADLVKLRGLDLRAVIVSSADEEYDFVSRFFAPDCGVPEDPVTGSAHCILAPFWGKRLAKTVLKAKQLSKRGGEVLCELKDDRVLLSGKAVLFMQGEIYLSPMKMRTLDDEI